MGYEILSEGEIFDRGDGISKKYHIIYLDSKWKDKILKLQQKIIDGLLDEELYMPLTEEEIDDIFAGKGLILGVIVDEDLAGARFISYDDEETLELSTKLQLPFEEVVFFESTVIGERFRGNHLQQIMMQIGLECVENLHRFKYAVTTVSPKNTPSLRNITACGFEVVKTESLYGGKLRNICLRKV